MGKLRGFSAGKRASMINLRILAAYLKSRKGVEFTMGMLAIIIVIIVGLILFILFLTGKWGDLTSVFGSVEDKAIANIPE